MNLRKTIKQLGLVGLLAVSNIDNMYSKPMEVKKYTCGEIGNPKAPTNYCEAVVDGNVIWMNDDDRDGKINSAYLTDLTGKESLKVVRDQFGLKRLQPLYDALRRANGKPIEYSTPLN